jgi:hypothetical protein
MMYRFHTNIFALPLHAKVGRSIELRGVCVTTLQGQPFDAFLTVTFEQAVDALIELPRLDAEPDGFFVIAGDDDGRRWQVDGHLFDFGGRLHRVELHGECPPADFDALLRSLGWPQTQLAFELVREGVALDEAAFRQWAAAVPNS